MSGTRVENVYMARLAEQAERYEDMVTYMTRVANMGAELNVEERNLLSVAFKNAVGARRVSWRSITSMMQKEDPANPHMPSITAYKDQVEREMNTKCDEILNLLRKADGLINLATNSEGQVFYLKMEGDYHRYLAEFSGEQERAAHAANALNAYTRASDLAKTGLPATHPIRLGLALNFSVFYYEVYGRAQEACQLAKASYDEAAPEFDQLNGDQRKDSEAIMLLLRDNLQLWSVNLQQGDGKAPEQDGTLCEDL